jgi:hypothetical protein
MGDVNAWVSSISTSEGGPLEAYAGVICEEYGTRSEVFGATSYEAEVTLRCPWAIRNLVTWDIYQNNVTYPDNDHAFVAGWTIKPDMQRPNDVYIQNIQYTDALITLKYSTLEAEAQKLFTQSWEPALENQVLNHNDFYWQFAGLDSKFRTLLPKESPARLFVMWNYTINWLQQKVVPFQFYSLAGCVNNGIYTMQPGIIPDDADAREKDLPSFSMLYQPGKVTPSVHMRLVPGGDPTPPDEKFPINGWDYTLKFTINRVLSSDDGGATGVYLGLWNRPFRSDALIPAGNTNPYLNYEGIYKKKLTGPGEAFPLYQTKDFPVDNGTDTGIHFLPGSSTLLYKKRAVR